MKQAARFDGRVLQRRLGETETASFEGWRTATPEKAGAISAEFDGRRAFPGGAETKQHCAGKYFARVRNIA